MKLFKNSKKPTREQIRKRFAELQAEREKVIAESTAARLEAITTAEQELVQLEHQLRRDENLILAESQPSDQEQQLTADILDSMERERTIMAEVKSISDKFIRADAVEFFQSELIERRKQIDQQMESFKGVDHVRIGGRLISELTKLQADEEHFSRVTKKICIAGEKIFALRQQRRQAEVQREELRKQRESAALSSVA